MNRALGKISCILAIAVLAVNCQMATSPGKSMAAVARSVTTPLTLAVNLSSTIGTAKHVANGSLYGISETYPTDITGLVGPLNPNVFTQPARAGTGYQQPYGAAIPVAGRLTGTTGKVMLRLADICPNWPYTFPGITNWLSAVTSVISDKLASGYSNFYGYEIWNEPVYTWNTANGDFNSFWKQTYQLIRSKDPTAKIVGPSDGYYDATRFTQFLTYCKANNCVPDIISWHELASNGGTGASTITADINSVRSVESSLGIANLPISINEYCNVDHNLEGAPGPSTPLIAKFERLGVDSACISWWWTSNFGFLGSLLANQTSKGGGWWYYQWYGDLQGNMVSVTPPVDASADVDGLASVDATRKRADIMFGGDNNGTVTVSVSGIPSWFGSTVRAIVEEATWPGRTTPVYVTNVNANPLLTVSGGAASLTLTGLNTTSGYRVILLPGAASVTSITSGATYKLVNLNSGKVLGISGASTSLGASALQWGDTGTADHLWTITSVSGYYRIKNNNSGDVLGISGMSTADGAQALQWTDNGTADHDWTLSTTGDGTWTITNRNSGKVLAELNMSTLDGASAIQWTGAGTADQRWILVKQ
jgi:hypothetical protein